MSDPGKQRSLRIGDAERDSAAEQLREHLAQGRLQPNEFDERLDRALQARTEADLRPLFADLPGPRPTQGLEPSTGADAAPATATQPATGSDWWGHWGIFAATIALAAATQGRLGILIPLVAAWVFWVYPTYVQRRSRHATVALTAADLGPDQRREITGLVNSDQKIRAIKRYRELTGADLLTAKTAIDTWQGQLER